MGKTWEWAWVGELRWRHRLAQIAFGLKVLWNAVRGYELTVQWNGGNGN